MSTPYHLEIFKSANSRLFINYSGIKDDIADENLKFNIYATNENGIPIFTQQLSIDEVRVLYNHLNAISVIKDGAEHSSKFIETTDEINVLIQKFEQDDLETISLFLQKFESDEKIKGLLLSLNKIEIENLRGAFHHKYMKEEILILEKLIELELSNKITTEIDNYPELIKYKAGQPEKIFQNWIENNLWVFGIEYVKQHDARKIALFSEGDLLMESVDGFLDLIELKRPKHSLLKYDDSHSCYYPHNDLSIVLGQSLFYLQKLSEYKLNLEKEYKTKVLMPRVKIIIGISNDFDEAQFHCLRMVNSGLNSIQIISYSDLVKFGQMLINAYEKYNIDD
jgi:hypothetical protein